MELQRKALFNLLRMNWLHEPIVDVAEWQVEDYRALPLEELFARLEQEEIRLNPDSFVAFSEKYENPEELTDELLADREADGPTQDKTYLLVFELWRRLVPEKVCLSIFCDELDHQIARYDGGDHASPEQLEDALANLQAILNENTDLGNEPKEVFKNISEACAHNIEEFLYDFIADQIDTDNEAYASELLDGLYDYVGDQKWFKLLRARILALKDLQEANQLFGHIVDEYGSDDMQFSLETLSYMVLGGERHIFVDLVKKTIPLLIKEEDLRDLLEICAEYYQRLDYDEEEKAIQALVKSRQHVSPNNALDHNDPILAELISILQLRAT